MFKRRILIIEDDCRYGEYLHTELIVEGYDACTVQHEKETIEFLQQHLYPDLILTSTQLSDDVVNQLNLLQTKREFTNTIPVIQLYSRDIFLAIHDHLDYVYWPKYPPHKLAKNIHMIFTYGT